MRIRSRIIRNVKCDKYYLCWRCLQWLRRQDGKEVEGRPSKRSTIPSTNQNRRQSECWQAASNGSAQPGKNGIGPSSLRPTLVLFHKQDGGRVSDRLERIWVFINALIPVLNWTRLVKSLTENETRGAVEGGGGGGGGGSEGGVAWYKDGTSRTWQLWRRPIFKVVLLDGILLVWGLSVSTASCVCTGLLLFRESPSPLLLRVSLFRHSLSTIKWLLAGTLSATWQWFLSTFCCCFC